jgi:thaumarchaeosortase
VGWHSLRKDWFHIALIILIVSPIVMLAVLDYYNLEGFNYRFNRDTNSFQPWTNTFFDQNFTFDLTWKGRMFYSIFAWFLMIESAFGWQKLVDKKPKKRVVMAASLICAGIPMAYVLATNFFGLDLTLLKAGYNIGIPSVTANNDPSDFLHLQWPLSVEYVVFFVFFLLALLIAYRPRGLKIFGISLVFLGAIAVAYMLDTIFPFGVFRPLQEMALPTAAAAAALFDILGYKVMLTYPMTGTGSSLPGLTVAMGGKQAGVEIAWACAGVYSLLLYVLIIFVFFKRTNISGYRKVLYFFIGLFGTFFANVLRIYGVLVVMMQSGRDEGMIFHNTWGEFFGFGWIFGFILVIVCIERFMLVERGRGLFQKISVRLAKPKNNSLPNVESETGTKES